MVVCGLGRDHVAGYLVAYWIADYPVDSYPVRQIVNHSHLAADTIVAEDAALAGFAAAA